MKKNVLILFGGVSTEHEISCVSASFVNKCTSRDKYNVYAMGITKSGAWWLYDGDIDNISSGKWESDTQNLRPAILSPCSVHHGIMVLNKQTHTYDIIKIDVAFPVLHGKNGEDGTVQGLLQLAGIPFVGPSAYSSAACMDKVTTKIICESHGIKTSPFIYARKSPDFDYNDTLAKAEESFDYPMFVKPANSGSSVGITKVKNRAQLLKGIETAFENDSKILIEKEVKGKEIEVAVYSNNGVIKTSTPGEIAPGADFYDYDTKYKNDTAQTFIPARISKGATEKVVSLAKQAFTALDCNSLSRVDFFVDGETVILNEINTIPGFTPISMYPTLMADSGLGGEALIDALLDSARTY